MTSRHFAIDKFLGGRAELPASLAGGTITDDQEIQSHLREGCPTCSADLRFAQKLSEVVRRDLLATPSNAVVERARALFRIGVPAQDRQKMRFSIGDPLQMVFDTYLQPVPE